jgi:hypothetical protein
LARIRVTHDIDDLANDLAAIPVTGARKFATTVRKNAEQGNRLARGYAKESAGAHGKHYHRAFSAEAITPLEWEYGPDASKPQGGMSFERGSRNQPYHGDLDRSLDVQGPRFATDIGNDVDSLFWGS